MKLHAKQEKCQEWLEKADILTEALPFMQRYAEQIIVIKFGGNAMESPELTQQFAQDIVLLKQAGLHPVIVHGGGPQIENMLNKLNIKTKFSNGLRVTDHDTIEIVEMVLTGKVNKEIVSKINHAGGMAIGLSGKDANFMIAKKLEGKTKTEDLGFVGLPTTINPQIIHTLNKHGMIPVIAPIMSSIEGETLNVNADTVAGELASTLNAKRLLLLTDIVGLLDKDGELIERIATNQCQELIDNGTVTSGMIPKLTTSVNAKQDGVDAVVILDGRVPHAILLELFTELGAGTLIE